MTVTKDIAQSWQRIVNYMQDRFEKEADVRSVLFVIGLRELGRQKKKFSKEEKQDLMNLALCKVFSLDGYFAVTHLDGEGWPIWKQVKPMPPMNNKQQEDFIKAYIIRYFEEEGLLEKGE